MYLLRRIENRIAEVIRTAIKTELEKQRVQLRKSIRDALVVDRTLTAPASAWSLNIHRPGSPQPNTVIDVGVGRGTPALYQAYPLAHHLLIEPVAAFAPDIENILTKYKGSWVQAAASNVEGRRTFFVNNKFKQTSSFAKGNPDPGAGLNFEAREVDVVRIDRLVELRGLEGPFIIKTDVEGFDLQALEGAGDLLNQTTFVIAECRADKDFTEPTLNNIVKFLYAHGFNIVELLDVKWEKEDGRLRWANIAFANDRFLTASG